MASHAKQELELSSHGVEKMSVCVTRRGLDFESEDHESYLSCAVNELCDPGKFTSPF